MLNCHSNSLLVKTSLPDAKRSKLNPKRRGVWAPASLYVLTEQPLHEVNHNGGSVSGGGVPGKANGVGGSRNDRDRGTLLTDNSLRVHGSKGLIPGKIWMPSNQIRATPARTHVSRELRARALQASRGI